MRFDVDAAAAARSSRIPRGRMRTLEKLPAPNASRRWDLSLRRPRPACSGRSPTAASTRRASTCGRGSGTTELWQWHNPSNRVHPMHLHGMLFRIVERSIGVIHPGDRGWKDTIGVLPGETATVQPWFIPYTGRYVFHCHALEHGDKAMMLQLEVERMKRVSLGIGARARRCSPPPALAADAASITGHDTLVWDKPNVAIAARARRSRWTFPGTTQAHNVASDGADVVDPVWTSFNSPLGAAGAATPTFTFTRPRATYKFVCTVHRDTMFGHGVRRHRAGAAAGPLPLSQQPFVNDDAAPVALEKVVRGQGQAEAVVGLGASASRKGAVARALPRQRGVRRAACASSAAAGRSRPVTLVGTGTRRVTFRGAEGRPLQRRGARDRHRREPLAIKKTSITVR